MPDEIKEEISDNEIIVSMIEEDLIRETEEMEKKKEKKLGKLVSRLIHPVYISYGGQGLVIPPRGKVKKVDKELLGAIPKGVSYIE